MNVLFHLYVQGHLNFIFERRCRKNSLLSIYPYMVKENSFIFVKNCLNTTIPQRTKENRNKCGDVRDNNFIFISGCIRRPLATYHITTSIFYYFSWLELFVIANFGKKIFTKTKQEVSALFLVMFLVKQ
jgi:hypothetical protein